MKYTKQVRVPITEKMSNQLSHVDNKVQFIRQSIIEKLSRKKNELDEFNSILGRVTPILSN